MKEQSQFLCIKLQNLKQVNLMRYSFSQKIRSLPLFVDSLGYQWQQESIKRPKGYHYVHWLHTQKGEGIVEINQKKYHLTEHSGILINEGVPHNYYALSDDWTTAYFTFGGVLIQDMMNLLQFGDYQLLNTNVPTIDRFISELLDQEIKEHIEYQYEASGLVYQFLMLIKNHTDRKHYSSAKYQQIVQPILNLIETSYASDLSNQNMADIVGYTPQYVNKVFKEQIDISPTQYLASYRIRKAKELMIQKNKMSIEEIALLVGFQTVNYFITVFRKQEKITPYQFKQSLQ
ncbi:AraC family transcriptional regulator [Enterococcus alcedinis]|nr:helix-turn-helix transcriptional regulator [Enterococcus alcedinis]